jgi:predicted phosphodiesterase
LNEPENQGLVISSFFKDLDIKTEPNNKENTYCIISGDLLQRGNSEKLFNDFYIKFIMKLLKYVPIQNIFCTPGNHDLDRNVVKENLTDHDAILKKDCSETEFNDFFKVKDNLIHKKFQLFTNFCQQKLHSSNYNLLGYSELIVPEITFYFLNSSLLSCGGLNEIDDKGNLKIETSELNNWITNNKGRTKILVMHHPIDHLSEYGKSELNSMLKEDINILISGHIHDQELKQLYAAQKEGLIELGSPQLFSDKSDLNGYSLITFEDNKIESVEYREWIARQRKFMAGQNFTGTENGIWKFNKKINISPNDFISMRLQSNFQKVMRSYSKTPVWIERFLSTCAPNCLSKIESKRLDYINVINSTNNFQIIAAGQFGLTCYAHYLAVKAWEIKNECWVYFDTNNWTVGKFHADLEEALTSLNITKEDIKCILLDNWKNAAKDSHKILATIKTLSSQIKLIILTNYHDNIILEGLDSEESHEGFTQLYLCELSKQGMRNIVKDFNSSYNIADENRVLERLNVDLLDLNIHRTPINCIQLLIAFLNDFEDRPINRTKVFKYVLKVIFDNPGNLFYGNTIDEDNCEFIMGYFCEDLLRNNKCSFTESEFLIKTENFCKMEYNSTNVNDLLQVLKNNQIVVNYNGELRFRFYYWIYYFAAVRMKDSEDFRNYVLNIMHSLYFPEIIEFYTGIDGRAVDVVNLLIKEIDCLSRKVHLNIGLNEEINPYKDIKWAFNETISGMTQEQLEQNIKESKLSDEIKDIVADKKYDSVKPYAQTIHNYLEEYDVKNLMDIIRSASRALRNSEFIRPESKKELLEKIAMAWKELLRALYLIAPVLSKNGFGGVGGARFKLAEDFPEEYNECLKSIIIALPYNLNMWFKDDLFSDKLILLFRNYRFNVDDFTIKHVLALIECKAKPTGWKKSILGYISQLHKNSFYLGDLYNNLRGNYSNDLLTLHEQKDTEYLIKACWAKHNTSSPKPGTNTVSKVSNDILPDRNPKPAS